MPETVSSLLAATELFGSLDPDALAWLEGEIERRRLPGGEVLFQQDDTADCMYVVTSGRLRISIENPADGTERVIGEVGRGDTVGEMAMLTGEARSATAHAVRDTELLRLSKDAFTRLVEQHPPMMLFLTRRIVTRYRSALTAHGRGVGAATVSTIALIPTSRDVPLSEFAQRLALALGPAGTVLRLTSDRVNAELWPEAAQTPQDSSRNDEIVGWLNAREAEHRFILYEADLVRSPWSGRCVRQADRVLLIASSATDPAPGQLEAAMARDGSDNATRRKELVLLHRERRDIYPNTRAWLEPRRVERHHHVATDTPSDIARLARWLTGEATGVVLGGGGARAFAQIGVLKALHEAGVPVDIVGGTSMGAFVGAQYAMGWDFERMRAFNKDVWTRIKPLKDYTLPWVGMITGNKFRALTREIYGEAHIEDLALPFFCCSSNITRARVNVHRTGLVRRWLAASIAVPGVAPPVCDRGDLLCDGAVLANLPIDVMRRQCDGTVIAVDVSPAEELTTDPDYLDPPSAWWIAYRRLNPFTANLQVPSMFELLGRISLLGSVQAVAELRGEADLFLHPPIERFGMFDFAHIDDLVATGHDYAADAIAEWRRAEGMTDAAAPHPRRRVTSPVQAM